MIWLWCNSIAKFHCHKKGATYSKITEAVGFCLQTCNCGFDMKVMSKGNKHKLNYTSIHLCYSCTMAAHGLRGMREWRRYIDHEGGARVDL